jgi:hypothetical protein
MDAVIDEKRVIRVSLGYLAVILSGIIGGSIFLYSLRSDLMAVLNRIDRHETMLERNQESIMGLQYDLKDFKEMYNRDANRYIRDYGDRGSPKTNH